MKTRVRAQITRIRASIKGLSPEATALIVVLGLVLGVFPVYGCPTILCVGVAMVFRLNLPAIQLINQISSPLQLALLVPLGRAGERVLVLGAVHTPAAWNLADAARNAIVGWCCFCLPAGVVLYLILAVVLRGRRSASLHTTECPA